MKNNAQTATELAVFGAILIFLIGLIVQQAMGIHHLQNQNLRSVRLAMKFSYVHSAGLVGPPRVMNNQVAGNKSRDFASILIIEDRLSTDAGKFGALNRAPSVSGSSGTHSRNYFMPLDANRIQDIPKYDIFVNGKHIPLSTGDFKTICMTQTELLCPVGYDALNPRHFWIGDLDKDGIIDNPNFWEPNCVSRAGAPPQIFGCARLYAITSNNPVNDSWCGGGACPGGFSANQRFNLDRDPAGTVDVPGALQPSFSWQWILVSAFDMDRQIELDGKLTLLVGEPISFGQEEGSEVRNLQVDVDNDLEEENIIRNDPDGAIPPVFIVNGVSGVVEMMMVLDTNDGDIDFSYDTSDYRLYLADRVANPPPPGFTKEVAMYTRVNSGTYMEVTDVAANTRSAHKKDHVDIIQRILELSNNTGRFCDTAGNVVLDPDIWWDATNPVEVCAANCFDPANITLTCFDTDETPPRMFVRSRVGDYFGHQWLTDVSADPYVNFTVPAP